MQKKRVKHGLSKHSLYKTWGNIIQRCNNHKSYSEISICDEWRHSFVSFYEWSIKNGWSQGLTIDRIDNSGNYEPVNCRYVTMQVQSLNKRSNRILNYKGVDMTIKEIIDKYNLNRGTFNKRIGNGWSVEDAIEKPVDLRFSTKR